METRPAERHEVGVATALGVRNGPGSVDGDLIAPKGRRSGFLWVADPLSVGSGFGTKERKTREIVAASFSILNARHRLIASTARPIDLGYAIANVIWTMAGSNTLREISYYNPIGERFSDDGVTLFGAGIPDLPFAGRRPV